MIQRIITLTALAAFAATVGIGLAIAMVETIEWIMTR